MIKNTLLVAIIFLGFSATTTGQASEVEYTLSLLGAEEASTKVRGLFGTAYALQSPEYRAQTISTVPKSIRNRRITRGKLLQRVETAIRPMFQLHDRSNKIELVLFHDDSLEIVPLAMLQRGCVLVVAESLAKALNDEELISIVAHELGHTYFMDEMLEAQKRGDYYLMRSIELECDAVAILSLQLLGGDPLAHLRGLRKQENIIDLRYLGRGVLPPHRDKTHPDITVRAQFAQRFLKLIRASAQPSIAGFGLTVSDAKFPLQPFSSYHAK